MNELPPFFAPLPSRRPCSLVFLLCAVSLLLSACAGLTRVEAPLGVAAAVPNTAPVTAPASAPESSPVAAPLSTTLSTTLSTPIMAPETKAADSAPAEQTGSSTPPDRQAPLPIAAPPVLTPPVALKPAPVAAPVAAPPAPPRPPAVFALVEPQETLELVTALPAGAFQSVAATQAPRELWDRIRRSYAMPDLQNELVRQHERFYTSRPEYLQRMVERSRKYLFHIVEELELRNMPTELALLPFVESAFNPQAVSVASAAGMWQFMPATGRSFDLKQNIFRDDRRDVLASTRAALDYLQKLYAMFGDWQLALASYNWGEGSVGRAIARNQRMGLGTRYEDLSMPNETRNYVPKLQALKNIVAAPQNFNSELPVIDNHPYFQDVEVRRDIDVALAAKLADIRLEDFKALNPSANRPIILAAGTGKILLPWDNAEVFKRNLEAQSAGRLASWTAWSVPSTMSVSEAARQAGMSESELRAINNIPPRMLIKAGSTLVVPRSPQMQDDVSDHLADNGALALAPEVALHKTTVKARKGDTVELLARRHRVSTENLAQWNRVAANTSFKAGESVLLFLPARAASGTGKAPSRAVGTATAKPAPKKPVPQKTTASSKGKKVENKR
ncbi:MAG: transglycosylase SLT domain-containing protein [Betaproteobacteria bacterium]